MTRIRAASSTRFRLQNVLSDLNIGFTEEQAVSLYKSMDRNGTGRSEIEEVSFRID